MGTTLILCLAFLALLCLWYKNRKSSAKLFERCGIPGPKPHWFFGNIKEYRKTENVIWDQYLVDTFGPITGYFLGAKPVILVSDPELVTAIQRTESSLFLERPRKVPGGINPDPQRALMLGNLPVPQWKAMRKTLAPSFATGQLVQMTTIISPLIDKMILSISEGVAFNFYESFKTLTLDIIGNTAFGVESNIQENPDDPLMDAVAAEFAKSTNSFIITLFLCLPEISPALSKIRLWLAKWNSTLSTSSALWNLARDALLIRNVENPRQDLLQRLVDAQLPAVDIMANSVLFFEAAYETLSSSLGFIVHLLVKHQDIQDRVREELEDYLERNGDFDYRGVQSELGYLEAVVNEALRMYPPQTTFTGRAAAQDYNFEKILEDGTTRTYVIPKGVHIQVALSQIQHSEFWTDPEEFNPDRFLDKSNTQAIQFQAFGRGPRECIGKRYAMLVLKLTLAKLLSQFKLAASDSTEESISIQYKVATMTPKNGSWAVPLRI